MVVELNPVEARVIGCLLEKERTTPEQYPLSLNALTSACNQKSSRDPVMELSESTVQETLDELVRRGLVMNKSGFGSRVTKFRHRFCNTEFGTLKLTDGELAVVCVLLLRGPQTPGELRTRCERLHRFENVQQVETTLDSLLRREDGPFVVRLPREPGRREVRYAQLFTGQPDLAETRDDREEADPSTAERLEYLEIAVEALRQELADLKSKLGD